MNELLYGELVPFYHLLDPLDDHRDEGQAFGSVVADAVPGAQSLLELGSGAGHGAYYIKEKFQRVTLLDLSPPMLSLSERLNPDCEHIRGDMRTARLDRTFDGCLIHDAIAYMTSTSDLLAAVTTAFFHLRPKGAALLVPDCVKESFKDSYEHHAGDDGERSLRCISWAHDPDPADEAQVTDFALLLREDGRVRAAHDRHVFGLFGIATWIATCETAGFSVDVISRPLPDAYEGSAYTDKMFLCRKP